MRATIKPITVYLVSFYVLALPLLAILKHHYYKNFSRQKVEEMLTRTSKFRDKTSDPCFYSIFGDPVNSGNSYLKISLYCGNRKKSINTLSLEAIKDKTVRGAIRELGRVNGFDVLIKNNKIISLGKLQSSDHKKWYCFIDGKIIKDTGLQAPKGKTLECFWESNDEMGKIIEGITKKWKKT
jgi:hypothetical protein